MLELRDFHYDIIRDVHGGFYFPYVASFKGLWILHCFNNVDRFYDHFELSTLEQKFGYAVYEQLIYLKGKGYITV